MTFRLHKQHPGHCGIIVGAQDADTQGQAVRIHEAITRIETLAGHLIRINRPWQ